MGVTSDGQVVADMVIYPEPVYKSNDGGLTWEGAGPDSWTWDVDWSAWERGQDYVVTPRGTFTFREADVFRRKVSIEQLVYSASYPDSESNHWARHSKTATYYCEMPATAAYTILYDPVSDHVVVALADLGVAVGLPTGEWVEIQVGEFAPVDYSYYGKLARLTTHGFWPFALLTAVLLVVSVALVVRHWDRDLIGYASIGFIYVFLYFVGVIIVFSLEPGWGFVSDRIYVIYVFVLSALSTLPGLVSLLAFKLPGANVLRKGIGFGCIFCGWTVILIPWYLSPGPSGLAPLPTGDIRVFLALLTLSLYFSLLALFLCCNRKFVVSVGVAVAVCYAIIVGSYLLWIANIVPSINLQLIPIALFLVVLAVYWIRRTKSDDAGLDSGDSDESRAGVSIS